MTVALGSNAVVKFCQEQVWGTTPALPAKVYGITMRNESIGSTKNLFQSECINQFRSVVGLGDGNLAVAGNISTDLFPEGLEIFLRHLLGKPTVVTTGSGPYTHVMKGDGGYLEGLSIEKGFVNISKYFKYTGCRVNSMNINLVQEGFHEVVFDFVGKKEEDPSATTMITGTPVYADVNGYTGYQCVVATDHTGSYVDLGNVVSGSININNNIETDKFVLGSPYRASANMGKRECKGDFTVFFEDTSLYAIYKSGVECGIKFTFTNVTNQQLIIEFPVCKIGGEAPKIASAGGVNLPLNFQARRDGTTALTDVIITLINSVPVIETAPGE